MGFVSQILLRQRSARPAQVSSAGHSSTRCVTPALGAVRAGVSDCVFVQGARRV